LRHCQLVDEEVSKIFPGRSIVTYDRENRSDLSALANDAIVVATSALQTGTNIPRLDLTINYGYAYPPMKKSCVYF
jgi:primosomal protein N'